MVSMVASTASCSRVFVKLASRGPSEDTFYFILEQVSPLFRSPSLSNDERGWASCHFDDILSAKKIAQASDFPKEILVAS